MWDSPGNARVTPTRFDLSSTVKSSWQALVSPIEQIIDLDRFGAALLVTSECDGAAWQPGGPFEDGPKLLLPGSKYSVRSRKRYREQSLLGVEIISSALMQVGVPAESILHLDCQDGLESHRDPVQEIQSFWSDTLNPVTRHRDALIYYFGFALETGQWALTWTNHEGYSKVCILDPDLILPPCGPDDGVPGARLVVSDAPGTARMWMRPARRLRPVAAWLGEAMPGSTSGPPLARWLAGYMPEVPKGVLAFLSPPPEAGLEDLPCHLALFWGPSPPSTPQLSRHLLWELTEFVGATTMRYHRAAATEEILIKGGPQMLLAILESQITRGQDDLALKLLWLLQALAAEAPTERWADTMNEALSPAMSIPDWLGHGYEQIGQHPSVLAAILSFLASCASQCATCREECSRARWPQIQRLIFSAFRSLESEHDHEHAQAARAGCRMTSQVAAHHALDVKEHEELVLQLLGFLGQSGPSEQELTEAAAEALLYVTFRCNASKLQVLELIQQNKDCICEALSRSTKSSCIERILMFLRSLCAAQPASAVMDAFPEGCHEGGIVDVVIATLLRFETDPGVQRWGLAALGTVGAADERFAQRAVDAGAAQSVVWALGADSLSQAKSLEQDALFCAYALLSTESGQEQLAPSHPKHRGDSAVLPGLAASAVARALREDSSEAAMWGMRIFERICQRHAFVIEPYVDVILDAMLAEGCLHGTMVAASNAVSHLASVYPKAREKLLGRYVSLVKALQCMGHMAACEGTEDGKEREKELMDWVQVLVDILGPPRPLKSDDQILQEQLKKEEAQETPEDVKSVSKSGSKSNTGTKSNPGTKSRTGTKLEGSAGGGTPVDGSRSGTKSGTKEGAANRDTSGSKGPSRTKSNLAVPK